MSLESGLQTDVYYKVESTFGTAPGASGATGIRRISTGLNLRKDTARTRELRTDRLLSDFRHLKRYTEGPHSGHLAGGSWKDWFEAGFCGTWAAVVSKSNADLTSIVSSSAGPSFTCGGSTWAAQGFRVGDVVRFTGLAATANNNKNFTITGLSSTVMTVAEAVTTDAVADTSFTVATVGKKLVPGTTERTFYLEELHTPNDLSRLFDGSAVNSIRIQAPPDDLATVEFGWMGRDMTIVSGASSPYYSSPTAAAEQTALVLTDGQVVLAGSVLAYITGLELNIANNISRPNVATALVPKLFWGEFDVTGSLSLLFNGSTELDAFKAETEVDLHVQFSEPETAPADVLKLYLPRIKYSAADLNPSGNGPLQISVPFQALKKATATGYDATTIMMMDSQA